MLSSQGDPKGGKFREQKVCGCVCVCYADAAAGDLEPSCPSMEKRDFKTAEHGAKENGGPRHNSSTF